MATLDLLTFGPTVKGVQVAIHPVTGRELLKRKEQIPDPLVVDGLVDTGADGCALRLELAQRLKLQQIDTVDVWAAHGKNRTTPVYFARLILPNGKAHTTRVIGVDNHAQFPLIIGRDLLASCVFTYNGLTGDLRLDFARG